MYSLILMTALTASAPEAPSGIFFNRCGCCGACYGSCYGCYGACTGCYGSTACYGCHGCWGSCYGCGGCYGCTGCTGCYGYGGIWGGTWSYAEVFPFAPPSYIPTKVSEMSPPTKKVNGKGGEGPARLIIGAPDGAKLYIDDMLMKTTTAERQYYTPSLEPGQKYYYELRVEMEKDGQKMAQTKRVIVEAGAIVRESFRTFGAPGVASTGK